MINANELRIGNWVANVHTGVPVKVLEVLTSSILVNTDTLKFTKSYTVPSKAYKGIPLTPEILEKCGFKFTDNGEDFNTWENKVEIWQHDEGFCHSYAFGGDINYLHQLQNLYWCLCGQELEINL